MMTAIGYAALSAGRFDPSVGPLVDLWGIGSESARVPGNDEIRTVLPLVNYRGIQVDPEANTITLENEGMAVDLGAIAKGWIADRMIDYLRENGEEHILANLGGNVMVSGGKPDGKPFKIGMQNPLSDRGEYLGIFSLTDGSVVSSGIYERFMESDGVRYHHILDTVNGYPADNGLASVTVISDHSVDGDALSTTLFILGIDEGFKLLDSLPGIEAAFTTKDNRVVMTSGAAGIFEATVPNLQMEIRN
jgi:thiamine biosynthesis lipoprotein